MKLIRNGTLSVTHRLCFLLFLSVGAIDLAFAIEIETDFRTTTDAIGASESIVPLWLASNRLGVYEDTEFQGSAGLTGNASVNMGSGFRLQSSLSVRYRASENSEPILPAAWVGGSYRGFLLRGGVVPLTMGKLPNPVLSSGSMAVSRNARPVPRITFGLDGFQPVPLLGSFLETDFGISHGWLTDDRYAEGTLLHEKWLYLRVKRESFFGVHAGIVHEAMWGGDTTSAAPVNFDNYARVFFGRSGGEDSSLSDQINALGNTLGIWDFGIDLEFSGAKLHGYYQHFFEGMGSFWRFRNAHDGLWGATLQLKEPHRYLPSSFLYERMITKFQSGAYHDLAGVQLGGRDSYYSNGTYRSGWTHYGRIIGTPFFRTAGEGEDLRIASNRVDVHHYGVGGIIADRTQYRFLFSRVSHRQAYAPVSLVDPDSNKVQWHLLLELKQSQLFGLEQLNGTVGFGLDAGRLYDTTVGMLLSASWKLW